MAIIERIVTVYNDKGSKKALNDLKKLEDNFVKASKKITKAFGAATLAAGGLALKIGKDAVKAAMEDQKAQRILALTLEKTTGATASQVAAVESYILQTSLATGITDNELRPAFSRLVRSTNDVVSAQSLLNLTLDISSATGKSVELIANSLGKAYDGNASALGRLGLGIDQSVIKSKDFNKIFKVLQTTFGGFADKEAQTLDGRIRRVGVAFDELKENIGFSLLPVFEDLVRMFADEILPTLQEFAQANQEQIAKAFKDVVTFAINAAKALGGMFKVISDNLTTFKVFAGILTGIFVGTKVYAGIVAVTGALALLTQQFKRQAVAGTAAGTATAFATGGASALAAAAGLTAFAAAAGITWLAINKLTDEININTTAMNDYTKATNGHIQELGRLAQATAAANLAGTKNLKIITTTSAKTKAQILLEKTLAALKKKGIVPTSSLPKETQEAINLEAARLNQIKQGNLEEQRRVEALMANLEAQMKLNEAAQRYADLLTVLSDQVISDQEVSVLAQKWNITKGEVLEYIARIYAANSTDLNDGPIVNLLMKWGLTKEEAEKYVDFTRALKDEKIDDKEIEELMGKWGMTRAEVLDYAKTVQDGTALQKAISKSWALPGDEAAEAWKRALAALNAYLAALANVPSGTPSTPSTTPTPRPNPRIPNPFNPRSPSLTAEEVRQQIATLTALRASTQAGTGISFLLKEHIDTLTDSLSITSLNALGDEQARLRAMGTFDGRGIGTTTTFDPASFRMGENAGLTINMTVQGNVQSEKDLADAIRQRILSEQASGKPIVFVGGL